LTRHLGYPGRRQRRGTFDRAAQNFAAVQSDAVFYV
jgi:hypothetical protein